MSSRLKLRYICSAKKHMSRPPRGRGDNAETVLLQCSCLVTMMQHCCSLFASRGCEVTSHTLGTNNWKKKDSILFYTVSPSIIVEVLKKMKKREKRAGNSLCTVVP